MSRGSISINQPLPARLGANTQAYLFLTITAMCWAANTIFAKLAVGEVSPMQLIAWRWLGVVILAWLLAWRGIVKHWPVIRQNLGYLTLMGALGFSCFNALFYAAAHSTTALNMGIVQGSIPVFVILGVWVFYGARVQPLQLLGAAMTIVGAITVACRGDVQRLLSLSFNPGDLMIMVACMLYAVYTVWLRRKPAIPALVWFAMLATAAFAAAVPLAWVEWQLGAALWPSQQGWQLIGLIVLFPSFLAQVMFIKGVELIGPERSGVFVNLVPVLASMAAVIVLGETLHAYHGWGLALVLGGIWVAERFVRPVAV